MRTALEPSGEDKYQEAEGEQDRLSGQGQPTQGREDARPGRGSAGRKRGQGLSHGTPGQEQRQNEANWFTKE